MLAIEVEYLLGRSYSGTAQDRGEAEWPPHPSRLFSALVSAYHEVRLGEGARKALNWLEAQPPPRILASTAEPRTRILAYVPENYSGSHPGKEKRGKQPRPFPCCRPANPLIVYEWSESAPDAETLQEFARMVSYVAYLGQSRSMVRVALRSGGIDPNYVPDPDGVVPLRVPRPGRLEELETLYQAGRYSADGPQANYRQVEESGSQTTGTVFGEMVIFRVTKGPSMPIEATLLVGEATRRALMSLAGEFGLDSDLLSGHGRHPHCAVTALPSLGHQHSDGHLMGVAVVLPRLISGEDRRRVLTVCSLLERVVLGERVGVWTVEAAAASGAAVNLRAATWARSSRYWATATPILLDRFPKKNFTAERILGDCCSNQDLPAPLEIFHQPFAVLTGSKAVNEFRLQRSGEKRARWGVHGAIDFGVEVAGPMLLGAGRYFGLGLMRPLAVQQYEEILQRAFGQER